MRKRILSPTHSQQNNSHSVLRKKERRKTPTPCPPPSLVWFLCFLSFFTVGALGWRECVVLYPLSLFTLPHWARDKEFPRETGKGKDYLAVLASLCCALLTPTSLTSTCPARRMQPQSRFSAIWWLPPLHCHLLLRPHPRQAGQSSTTMACSPRLMLLPGRQPSGPLRPLLGGGGLPGLCQRHEGGHLRQLGERGRGGRLKKAKEEEARGAAAAAPTPLNGALQAQRAQAQDHVRQLQGLGGHVQLAQS